MVILVTLFTGLTGGEAALRGATLAVLIDAGAGDVGGRLERGAESPRRPA